MEINGPGLLYMFMYEIAATVDLCVRIIALLYSYCIVTPVKVTKSTSVHTAADVAEKERASGFISSRGGEKEGRVEEWKIGVSMEI